MKKKYSSPLLLDEIIIKNTTIPVSQDDSTAGGGEGSGDWDPNDPFAD